MTDQGWHPAATVSHTYSTAGTRTVTLTVTDSRGATASVSHQFVATVTLLAGDQFNRTVTNGWGNATSGGAWTVSGTASNYSVSSGRGLMRLPKGYGTTANLAGLTKISTDTTASFAADKAPRVVPSTSPRRLARSVPTSMPPSSRFPRRERSPRTSSGRPRGPKQ